MSRQPNPPNETPLQKFTRISESRISGIVSALDTLATMGGTVPDKAYVDKAFDVINSAVEKAYNAWLTKAPAPKRLSFTFGEVDPRQESLPVVPPQSNNSANSGKAAARK